MKNIITDLDLVIGKIITGCESCYDGLLALHLGKDEAIVFRAIQQYDEPPYIIITDRLEYWEAHELKLIDEAEYKILKEKEEKEYISRLKAERFELYDRLRKEFD